MTLNLLRSYLEYQKQMEDVTGVTRGDYNSIALVLYFDIFFDSVDHSTLLCNWENEV